MPRPQKKVEKSKDFFGSMKRLINDLKIFKVLIFVAIILATTSAILSLIAPNKLSDFTDTITKGLVPNTKELEKVNKSVMTNINVGLAKLPTVSSIAPEDLVETNETLTKIKTNEATIFDIKDSVLKVILDDIEVDKTTISVDDQIKYISLLKQMDKNDMNKSYALMDELPVSIKKLVEPKINMKRIKNIATFLAILYILSFLFGYCQNFIMTTVSNNYARKLRTRISDKINRLPLKYFDSHETGDVLSRLTNDVDSIAQNLNQSISSLVTAFTLFFGSIIMMFITNWVMAITAIVSSLIGFMFMGLILSKSQKYFMEKQKYLGKLNGFIEEMYSSHTVVKAYNGVDDAIKNFDVINDKLYKANKKSQFLSGLMGPLMGFIGNFGYVAVCVVGAMLTMKGYISFGVIVAFMIYIRLFTNPLSQIAQALTSLQSTAAASERVFEFMDEEEMEKENDELVYLDPKKAIGNIEFKNVKFSYDKNKPIIKDFSVNITKGMKVAIVGPTGAGKTTLVNLLMRFYEIDNGEILIDGINAKYLSRENIHDLFCMVLQDTWLFEGTIKENIKYNKKDITDEEIWNALEVVGIKHFVKTLPKGIDAMITDNETISSGQKQLFTIARGMLENAPFLILDEATSNVDTRTEELVQKAMDKLTKGKTSFIIAHRLSTIKNADLILVMKDGNIIETGNHEELINKNGFYAELYNSQFEI